MNMTDYHLVEALNKLKSGRSFSARIGVVLGSGLGNFVDLLEDIERIPFKDIPGFPVSTVEGHAGELICGELDGHCILVNSGRVHFYEGYTLEQVVYPIRILHGLGVKQLILTNAAGSVREDFKPGDLMIIDRLLNLTGRSVVDTESATPFSATLIKLADRVGHEASLGLKRGTYAGMTGPSYETPAEIRFLRHKGADAIGMSTIHESMLAKALGMEVLGISCLTNYASGILDQPLTHEEVVETGYRVRDNFASLIRMTIQSIH